HQIYYGFLSPKRVGMELAHLGIEFYKQHKRAPTHEEQVQFYYGEPVDPADFFIMSTKFAGLGALPPLICGQETQIYFLAAPGVMSLTLETYREIIYDLMFLRPEKPFREYPENDLNDIKLLREFLEQNKSRIFGLGKQIGTFWIPIR
ncbi:MAG: hypothetical protein JXC36_08245, partial [Candidatus Atribacteria bacterium]|nr:hypothetical protein [Candidatus Atribacteria bacterium]